MRDRDRMPRRDAATEEPAPAPAVPPLRARALELQRAAGNRATAAVLARDVLAPAQPATTLRQGSRGPEVMVLQARLNRVDEVKTPLAVDSIFGPITAKAVREFRKAHDLGPGAQADAATLAALEAAIAEPQDSDEIARKLFALGAVAYEQRRFQHAYDFFTQAGELSDRPGIVFSRAQALRRQGGQREKAIALYEAYLATGHDVRREEAKDFLRQLRAPERTGDPAKDDAAARRAFQAGAAHYEAGRFGHAYDEFTRAGEVSDRPGIVFSRAQALRRMGGRRGEAIALFERYLESGHGERDADARKHIAELRGPTPTGDAAADEQRARATFQQGAAAYGSGRYMVAADAFADAHVLSDRPALLFSQAQALRRAGGHAEAAIDLYEAYARTGGERAAEARAFAEALRTQGAVP